MTAERMNRAAVAVTLADTDLSTVMAAINASDKSLIRMADGNPPTPQQLEHILSATVEDYDAANELWQNRIQALEEDGEPW